MITNRVLFLAFLTVVNSFGVFGSAPALSSDTDDCSSPALNIPFKIGFEFQEVNGLCPWALDNFHLQKKPLFCLNTVLERGLMPRKLWHVELDTNDIEFVTEPFSFEEKNLLEECIVTLVEAFNILKHLLETKDPKGFSFEEWISQISRKLPDRVEPLNMDIVSDRLISSPARIRGEAYKPHFTPQFTLQHPLEYTIFLYFGLFGGKGPRDVLRFVDALPLRDLLIAGMQEADSSKVSSILMSYNQKMSGLIFLHALTLMSMIPDDDTQTNPFKVSAERFRSSFQIDAKSNFTIMSRRPFSFMYNDLPPESKRTSYAKVFNFAMQEMNERFESSIVLFEHANYGEQFFKEDGSRLDLRKYSNCFNSGSLGANEEHVKYLLENGVLTTTMVRYISEMQECMKVYLTEVSDISKMEYRHLNLEVAGEVPKMVETKKKHDALSPPWFLGNDDAMGRFKDQNDQKFGEAIIEIRGVSGIGSWFFKRMHLSDMNVGNLLTDYLKFQRDSMALFGYLSCLTQKDFHDIAEGMKYILLKF